jgi:hypothetical protein
MHELHRLAYAISIQNRCYELLLWLRGQLIQGKIPSSLGATVGHSGDAALSWITRHHCNLPEHCRPAAEELAHFANFFSTYLDSSFEISGKKPDVSCDCPFCLKMAGLAVLRTKTVIKADHRRADKLRIYRVTELAMQHGLEPTENTIVLLATGVTKSAASYAAYGHSLLERIQGWGSGPATLALWRDIAWHNDKPIRNFKLTAEDILEAERTLLTKLAAPTP